MEFILKMLVIIFTLMAAGFWLYSSIVRAPQRDMFTHGFNEAAITDNEGNDIVDKIRKQSFWSALAASSAGIAAICQAVLFVIE